MDISSQYFRRGSPFLHYGMAQWNGTNVVLLQQCHERAKYPPPWQSCHFNHHKRLKLSLEHQSESGQFSTSSKVLSIKYLEKILTQTRLLFKRRALSNLHSNTTAANNFPGFPFFVYLTETSPFSKFLVVINLRS